MQDGTGRRRVRLNVWAGMSSGQQVWLWTVLLAVLFFTALAVIFTFGPHHPDQMLQLQQQCQQQRGTWDDFHEVCRF